MRLDRGRLGLPNNPDLVPGANKPPNMEMEAEAGDAGGEEVVVDVGDNAEDTGGGIGVGAEEAVPVADLNHEDDVGVLGFEINDLLLEGRVFGVSGRARVRVLGRGVEKLLEEFLMEGFGGRRVRVSVRVWG